MRTLLIALAVIGLVLMLLGLLFKTVKWLLILGLVAIAIAVAAALVRGVTSRGS
ncbi:hypothetical protein HII36_52975 [Nonomuraea sp. NN258]|uniref:hypothetical protein n=1 Tax=Nonomuraea antri TaxID=2730852 RepID=UPI00156956C2|nr:hypothetical protein [Nonomuraea antri]NRQ40477.1 hypothetical protein [Nonomuraea antri]